MPPADIDQIARAFVAARAAGQPLPDYPGPMPTTLTEAYRIQERARTIHAAPVLGWKLGRIGPPLDVELGVNRLCGPIYSVVAADDPAMPPVMPVVAGGFAAAEAELMFRIGSLPDGADADPIDHIDAVHVGIEVAGSPFPGINDHGPFVTISDFGNNVGLVIGAAVPDWRGGAMAGWPVTVRIDGDLIATGRPRDVLDGPFAAVRFLFAEARRLNLPLAAGQWISAGAITGVHPVAPGAEISASFGEDLTVGCTITAIRTA